ncbi:MAG: hypothetical protein RLZZ618_1487 [Pseudomonadota bacterium]|jgi:pimeloyl-ACP methyl ester carboxylesterase
MAAKGSRGTLIFSHANSFPAGTYRVLFETWRAAGFTVHAIEKYGHDPAYPVTHHWPRLRDQLVDFIETHSSEPVWLVGHSLGGYLSVLTAARRPELARGIVLLDSPIIGGLIAPALQLARSTGFGGNFLPSNVSKGRRHHWPDADAAFEHFAAKPAFARWHPQVLKDYIACGIEPSTPPLDAGHTLSFRREIETDIYNTLPLEVPRFLRSHPLQCPVAFIGGKASSEVRKVGLGATESLIQGRLTWVEGTHLYPFEHPDVTAVEVVRWLSVFAAETAASAPVNNPANNNSNTNAA